MKDKRGNEHELPGRLEMLVMFIIENAGEIAKPQNARLLFNCSGSTVSATIEKTLERPQPGA